MRIKIVKTLKRREFFQLALAVTSAMSFSSFSLLAKNGEGGPLKKMIPSSKEEIPAIGMGTWRTFNVGEDPKARQIRLKILKAFFDYGGGMVDSSPMYGSSEEIIGYCLKNLEKSKGLFSATKVWTPFGQEGQEQVKNSHDLWGIDQFDLLQVHNLVSWQEHLEMLFEMKKQGKVKYVGITTSHGRRHEEFEKVMKKMPLDFVQFSYNILDREAEERLIPLAKEKKMAVIANRPFRTKELIYQFQDKPLPNWASEIDCENWPQFLLKFIISHPDITCTIPATSQIPHMHENMKAGRGKMPDEKIRKKMAAYVRSL